VARFDRDARNRLCELIWREIAVRTSAGMTMNINTWLIRHYLDYVLAGWFDYHELPPDALQEYDPYIENMKKVAAIHHELDQLRLGLEYIVSHPEFSISELGRTRYPYSDSEVRQAILYILESTRRDLGNGGATSLEEVRMVMTSLEDWKATRNTVLVR
jgi:hypothetical protein